MKEPKVIRLSPMLSILLLFHVGVVWGVVVYAALKTAAGG